jgi:hypothetical protein
MEADWASSRLYRFITRREPLVPYVQENGWAPTGSLEAVTNKSSFPAGN